MVTPLLQHYLLGDCSCYGNEVRSSRCRALIPSKLAIFLEPTNEYIHFASFEGSVNRGGGRRQYTYFVSRERGGGSKEYLPQLAQVHSTTVPPAALPFRLLSTRDLLREGQKVCAHVPDLLASNSNGVCLSQPGASSRAKRGCEFEFVDGGGHRRRARTRRVRPHARLITATPFSGPQASPQTSLIYGQGL